MNRFGLSLCALLLLAPVTAVFAHSFEPAVLDLHERAAGRFDVVWKLLPLAAGTSELLPQLPAACRRIDGAPATSADTSTTTYWRVDCGAAALHGEQLSVSGLDGSRVDVILRITWRDGTTASGVLHSGATEFVVPSSSGTSGVGSGATAGAVLWSYGRLGIEHIWLGFDHLLFVLGLLLLVESWGMLVKTISAFTVAHSIALALAVLGIVDVPPAPVEALIALSIVLVAVELARAPASAAGASPTLTRRFPWLVACGFGLVHGLGFAGALARVGLPPDQIPLALLAFNVGVEMGQLAFVLAITAPLALFTRLTRNAPRLQLLPAYAIGTIAVTWAIERIQQFWTPVG
jgi:hypothetical protein